MAIYKGNIKVSGVGKGFNPENSGTVGQVLTKTSTGYAYDDIPEVTVDSALSTTSENPVQNKVITNAIQNAGGASDHLEEKAPVGELYKLTDTMFLQNTPTLANSTAEQNVGDVAANTQIHIQRIGSGTSSNQLKLKLKKVGSPGDLSVKVMKGIQVTVTANVEAYWYGDSNNILASGTVSASSISTSWNEITVTLDNQVGGTEGQLLDIVLNIPSVSASNYVVLACDSTQRSEGFSLVAVNGSTRTRSKLMPYCVSNGFAQGLMCKTSTSTINGFFPKLKTQEFTGSGGHQGSSTMSPSTLSIKETSFSARIYTNGNTLQYSNNFAGLRITGKSYQYYFSNEFELTGGTSGNTTKWTTVNKSTVDTTVYMHIGSLQGSLTANGPVYLEYRERTTQAISKMIEGTHKLKPKKIGGLGVNTPMISFGRLPDSGWRTGE